MKIKKRTAIAPPKGLERTIQQIYDDINAIINAVNAFSLSGEEYEGSPGDIRIVEKQQNDYSSKYYIQFKTKDGWIEIEGSKVENV